MLNLLFSPSGRIGPSEFVKGAMALIIFGIVSSFISYAGFSAALEAILGLLTLVTLYCWVVLWIKRYHDAGKSGSKALIPIILYVIVATIAMFFLMGDLLALIFEAAAEGAEPSDEQIEAMTKDIMIPVIIVTVLIQLAFVFGFNRLIKHDPNDNQYGPA